jgi:Uma2 family endonuclease
MPIASATSVRLSFELAGALMTPAEFDAAGEWDDDYRYELIHGVLAVSPLPLPAETGPNETLGHWLLTCRGIHPQGSALDGTLPEQYVRTRDSRRRADRLIWVGLGRAPNRRRDIPNVAVEFVSRSRRDWLRDYVEKRREYLALGIDEYWIIDRFRRTLTVVRLQGKRYKQQIVREGETYRPALLPGFELPLAELLAVADRWADAED